MPHLTRHRFSYLKYHRVYSRNMTTIILFLVNPLNHTCTRNIFHKLYTIWNTQEVNSFIDDTCIYHFVRSSLYVIDLADVLNVVNHFCFWKPTQQILNLYHFLVLYWIVFWYSVHIANVFSVSNRQGLWIDRLFLSLATLYWYLSILMFGLNKTLKISGNQQCQKYEIVKNYFTENTTAREKDTYF